MKRERKLWIIFILFLSFLPTYIFAQGQEYNVENAIKSLSQDRKIDFTLIPTIHLYNNLCSSQGKSSGVVSQINQICKAVMQTDQCKKIDVKERLNCDTIEQTSQIDVWEFLKGCSKGVFDSVKSFLNFMWEILQWVWSNSTSSESRDQTIEQATEYMNIVKLYLHTEFEKAYAKESPPLQTVKALKRMGGAISNLLLNLISGMISEKYKEFGCLNFEAKSKVICQFVGEIFIPPAAAVALIKHGPKALKMFPNLKKAFNSLDELSDAAKIAKRDGVLPLIGKKIETVEINGGRSTPTDFPASSTKKTGGDMVRMNANHYDLQFESGGSRHSVRVIIPAAKNGSADGRMLEKIKSVVAQLPADAVKDVDKITVNPYRNKWDEYWEKEYKTKNFKSAATAGERLGERVIDIYPAGHKFTPPSMVANTMQHELGHIVAVRKYGETKPNAEWLKAIEADKRKVSDYGNNSHAEDFAEAMRIYLETDGGARKPELLRKYAGRFKILDEIMNVDVSARQQIAEELRVRMARQKVFWTTASVAGVSQLSSFSVENQTVVILDDGI